MNPQADGLLASLVKSRDLWWLALFTRALFVELCKKHLSEILKERRYTRDNKTMDMLMGCLRFLVM